MTLPRSEERMPNETRSAARLHARLDQRLISYLAAAAATGSGLLAGAQPAEAKVICTKTAMRVGETVAKTAMRVGETVAIDLNRDGIIDVSFLIGMARSNVQYLYATVPPGNGMFGKNYAAPMFFGVPIGPGEDFVGNVDIMGFFYCCEQGSGSGGSWAGKTNRYMGIKFTIGTQTHFGWVRLTLVNESETITGYAYETIPNKSIKAGDVGRIPASNEASAAAVRPPKQMSASLGLLARGADGLALWRRE